MSETAGEDAPAAGDGAAAKAAKGPRRSGPAHWIALARSLVYSAVATSYFVVLTILSLWMLLLPPATMRWAFNGWNASELWLMRVMVGQKLRVIGRENIPDGPALVAAKHQSAWETMALIPLLPCGTVIMKKELMQIPLFGWFARHFGMIPVDRSAGTRALKQLAEDARAALADGKQIVIFPEGTRRLVGAPPDYKPGAFFLYQQLGVPMVPVALNSGLLWPRGRLVRYPGTITVSFLPPIPPGLPRAEARAALIEAIETESDRLAGIG